MTVTMSDLYTSRTERTAAIVQPPGTDAVTGPGRQSTFEQNPAPRL